MRYLICMIIENEPGALSRVLGLFSQRNFNIESLNVAPTKAENISRITITTSGSKQVIEQITKNLNKLINVIKVVSLTEQPHIESEIMLIKVYAADNIKRDEVKRLSDIFGGKIVDTATTSYTVQICGSREKLEAFVQAVDVNSVLELVRSGVIGLSRGSKILNS